MACAVLVLLAQKNDPPKTGQLEVEAKTGRRKNVE
jgi:hypothetical protein